MKPFRLTAVLLLVPVFIGTGQAQEDVMAAANINWVGLYIGANSSGGWDIVCDNWEPDATGSKGHRGLTNAFYHRNYPSDGTFISGAPSGYDIQYAQWARDFSLDYQAYGGKQRNRAVPDAEASPVPHGTNTFFLSGKNSTNGFFTPDPAIGDAGDACFPYLRWGGVLTSGSRHLSTRFGETAGTVTFSGGKNYDSGGFATGAAIQYAMLDRCLFRAECTIKNLGKPDNSVDSIHNSVAANIFRWP